MTKLVAKKSKRVVSYTYTMDQISDEIITGTDSELKLIDMIREGDVKQKDAYHLAIASRLYSKARKEAAEKQDKGFAWPTWDIRAKAHWIAFAKGTPNKNTAAKDKRVLLTEKQHQSVRTEARWWNRQLEKAGIVSEHGNSKNKGKKRGPQNKVKAPKELKGNGRKAAQLAVEKVATPKEARNMIQTYLGLISKFVSGNAKAAAQFRAMVVKWQREVGTAKVSDKLPK